MRIRVMNTVLTIAAIALSGCTTAKHSPTQAASNLLHRQSITAFTHDTYPTKNPTAVSLYTAAETPHAAYRIIGLAKVSKYNMLGAKREANTINLMMKNLAASIGGDGLIDVSDNDNTVQAKVIAYQKILI